jgi:hypothetical protein
MKSWRRLRHRRPDPDRSKGSQDTDAPAITKADKALSRFARRERVSQEHRCTRESG